MSFKQPVLVDIIDTKWNTKVPLVCLKVPGAKFTILYSHGNATDLGGMFSRYVYIAVKLGVNVVGYDYTGYGVSDGNPTEKQTYKDIEAVFSWCLSTKLVTSPVDEIILYGQSVGSGPSCYLASKKPVAGLILHSAILSGIRVLTPSRVLCCFDIYPNISRIKSVQAPVFIIHGEEDEEVPVDHGKQLHSLVGEEFKYPPYFVEDRGHNDIWYENEEEVLQRLMKFLEFLRTPKASGIVKSGDHVDDGEENRYGFIDVSNYVDEVEPFVCNDDVSQRKEREAVPTRNADSLISDTKETSFTNHQVVVIEENTSNVDRDAL